MTAPNGGERFQPGQQVAIQWQSSDNIAVSSHTVRLSTDGGVTFGSDIARGLAGSAQSFLWTVPSIQTTAARIRVEAVDAAGNQGFGVSNANFGIQTGGLSVSGGTEPTDLQRIAAGGFVEFKGKVAVDIGETLVPKRLVATCIGILVTPSPLSF